MMWTMMILRLQFMDVCKFAAEMGSQALEHDMQLLELVLAGVWAWSASRWYCGGAVHLFWVDDSHKHCSLLMHKLFPSSNSAGDFQPRGRMIVLCR